eukprot:329682-Pyramimonas_sp.AAC.1
MLTNNITNNVRHGNGRLTMLSEITTTWQGYGTLTISAYPTNECVAGLQDSQSFPSQERVAVP